jgi:hypothetical protein
MVRVWVRNRARFRIEVRFKGLGLGLGLRFMIRVRDRVEDLQKPSVRLKIPLKNLSGFFPACIDLRTYVP